MTLIEIAALMAERPADEHVVIDGDKMIGWVYVNNRLITMIALI